MYNRFFNSDIISKNGTIPLATDVAAPESLCKIIRIIVSYYRRSTEYYTRILL